MSIKVIKQYVAGINTGLESINVNAINDAAQMLWDAYIKDQQIFVFGNGGSASTASHMACDIGKGTSRNGKKRFRIQSLCDNVATMTAWANDVCYENVFKDQLENLINPSDVVVAISASGNSPNVVQAVKFAKSRGAMIIGMSGFSGGELKILSDVDIHFSIRDYGQVEDLHLMCEHMITDCIREKMKHV